MELIAEHVGGGDVLVLLGPASTLGEAATLRRDDRAGEVMARWRELVPAENLLVEVVSQRLPGHAPGSASHAANAGGNCSGRPVQAGCILRMVLFQGSEIDLRAGGVGGI